MNARALALTVVLPSLFACATTRIGQALDTAPAAGAPLAVREAFAAKNRAHGVVTMSDEQRTGLGDLVPATVTFLQLEDGRRVENPADLLPAVDPHSASAKAARRSVEAHERAETLGMIGQGVNAAGFGLALASATAYAGMILSPPSEGEAVGALAFMGVASILSLATVSVGTLLFTEPANEAAHEAAVESATAFATYDEGLRQRLALPPPAFITSAAQAPTSSRPRRS